MSAARYNSSMGNRRRRLAVYIVRAIVVVIAAELAMTICAFRPGAWYHVAVIHAGAIVPILAEKRRRGKKYAELIDDRKRRSENRHRALL